MMAKRGGERSGERSEGSIVSGSQISQVRRSERQRVQSTAASQQGTSTSGDIQVLYSPVARMPNKNDLQRALTEFIRLEKEQEAKDIHENDRHVEVVLATGVNLRKWTNCKMENTIKYIRFEAMIVNGVTAQNINHVRNVMLLLPNC